MMGTAMARTGHAVAWTLVMLAAGIFAGFVGAYPAQVLPLVLLCVVAGLAILAVQRPDWGLYALTFATYLSLSEVAVNDHGAPSLAKFLVLGLLATVMVRWFLYGDRPTPDAGPLVAMGAVWLAAAVTVPFAANADAALDTLNRLTRDMAIGVLVLLVLVQPVMLRRVGWALIAAGAILGTISTHQYLTGSFDNSYFGFGKTELMQIVGDEASYRQTGPIADPNTYAQILLIVIPIAAERFAHTRSYIGRCLAGVAFVACVLSLVFTFSRGAFLALVVVGALMVISWYWRPRRLAAIALLVALALPFIPELYTDRLRAAGLWPGEPSTTKLHKADPAVEGRLTEMQVALYIFADHPVMGIGIGNFRDYFQSYVNRHGLPPRHEARQAHSLYLEIAAENGLIGLLAFSALIALAARSLWQGWRRLKRAHEEDLAARVQAIAFGLIGYGIAALFLHSAYGRYMWLILGIALACNRVSCAAVPTQAARSPGPDGPGRVQMR